MFHIVLILLCLALTYLAWHMVRFSPRVLSMVLPKQLTVAIGTFLFVIGIFSAFFAAFILRDADNMLGSMVTAYVGLWFVLATSSGQRGSDSDERMLRRLFCMMGLMTVAIVGSFYAPNTQAMAALNLGLVTGGLWMTTNYLSYLDRGR